MNHRDMRFPIKISRNLLPNWLHHVTPSHPDPRKLENSADADDDFSDWISALKIGKVWKTTKASRQPLSDEIIVKSIPPNAHPAILEVGASAGCASLDLMKVLNERFSRYYVTDISLFIEMIDVAGSAYLYDPASKRCIMKITDSLIFYEDTKGAIFPLGLIARNLLSRAPNYDKTKAKAVELTHPALRRMAINDPRIIICEYNILEPWTRDDVDIIKVANVLNILYFSKDEILRAALNMKRAMKLGGLILVIDNRRVEKISVFVNEESGLRIKQSINGGSEVAGIIEGIR